MMKPEEIEALADRIDHEQLWRRPIMERDSMTAEQRDRLDAAVYLRRFASQRFAVLQALEEGAEYMRGYKLTRANGGTDARGCGTSQWHKAINRFQDKLREAGKPWVSWLYQANKLSDEVPRMILQFEQERAGMPDKWKMCSLSQSKPLPDNHLRCHLGVECRKCYYLSAIESQDDMTNEAKDEAKAWTCAAHILLESKPDAHIEGYLRDKSDEAFDQHMLDMYAWESENQR